MMRRLTALFIGSMMLLSCNTYYVATSSENVTLYAAQDEISVAYSLPKGTVFLIKGHQKNGFTHLRYHNDPNWYWVANTSFTLIPGFNPKQYASTYSNYEGSATGQAPYDATIQTGSRGGKYYINKNGKKTYVKRSTPSGSIKRVGGSRKH